MHVIGHQTPGEHVYPSLSAALADELDVAAVVGRIEKGLLTPIATLRDVVCDTGNDDTSGAWHARNDAPGNRTKQEHLDHTFVQSEIVYSSCPELKAPAGAAQTVSQVLGEIVWLMSQSPAHKQFFIDDLEWLVMTPIMLQQFRLYYQDAPPAQGGKRPIGVVLWGLVSDEVDARLTAGTTRLRPHDWKSGDKAWVVEVIAPFGGGDAMVADLKAQVFKDRELRALVVKDGKREVRVV